MQKVPIASLFFGLTSFLFPFVALKENRVVRGDFFSGWQLANSLVLSISFLLFAGVLLLALISRNKQNKRVRLVYMVAGFAFYWIAAVLLAEAGTRVSGNAPRVSPALGFWGLPVAGYILVWYSEMLRDLGRFALGLLVCILPIALLLWGEHGQMISVFREWSARSDRFLGEIRIHIRLFSSAVIIAAFVGVPLGVWAAGKKSWSSFVSSVVDTMQTIPSMALFGLLVAPLAWLSRSLPFLRNLGFGGIGMFPALIALSMYALLPIVRNTIVGLNSVPQSIIEAGLVMGMSKSQLFFWIEWPMALPYIMTGLRTASVQTVGNTVVAALIGAGGLGVMIFQGLWQAAPDLILLGVLPLVIMAVLADRLWNFLIDRTLSPGLKIFIQGTDTN